MELARKADDAALAALVEVTRDANHPRRAAACIAFGATNRPDAAPALLYLLQDGDSFVRVCAWLGLEHLTGQHIFADWLDGDSRELDRGFREWGEWVVRHAR